MSLTLLTNYHKNVGKLFSTFKSKLTTTLYTINLPTFLCVCVCVCVVFFPERFLFLFSLPIWQHQWKYVVSGKCRPRPPTKAGILLTHVHGVCLKNIILCRFKTDGCYSFNNTFVSKRIKWCHVKIVSIEATVYQSKQHFLKTRLKSEDLSQKVPTF